MKASVLYSNGKSIVTAAVCCRYGHRLEIQRQKSIFDEIMLGTKLSAEHKGWQMSLAYKNLLKFSVG